MLAIIAIMWILIICLLYYYLTATFNYWKKRNVPGPSPTLFFGTTMDVIRGKMLFVEYFDNIYHAYKNAQFVGIFNMREPILIIKNPEHIKDVLIRDADIFFNRGVYALQMELINKFFFFLNGSTASGIKSKLLPLFSPSKMKDMYHMTLKSIARLDNHMEELLSKNNNIINCSGVIFKLSSDMLGSAFLDIQLTNPTNDSIEENEFLTHCYKLRGTYWSNLINGLIKKVFPRLYDWVNYYSFSNNETTRFFVNFTLNVIQYRKEHGIVKSDFIGMLAELKKNSEDYAELLGTNITDELLAAHVFGMFHAGYESSAMTICNTLYELAFNHNIQDKLRTEIHNAYAKNNDELQLEDIQSMPYLNAVFKETIRKYPIANSLQREASSSYTFRNTNVTVPRKQKIIIPLYSIHNDPKIYPQPEIYNPERFINEHMRSGNSMHYLAFGHGPRNCVGERLGMVQVKITLIKLLRNYKFDICDKTVSSLTCDVDKFISVPDVDIYLKVTKIN